MTEHDALFQAILDDPQADLPRLVYADFIEERLGQTERAEFIRIQIEMESMRQGPLGLIPEDSPYLMHNFRYHKLFRRADELHAMNEKKWFGQFYSQSFTVRRGFISEVSAPLDVLMGGRCNKCEGDGVSMVADYHRWKSCKTCHGTGRTPSILPRLVREQPIEFVRATNSEPYHNGYGYAWFNSARARPAADVPQTATIPTDLFEVLADLFPHSPASGVRTTDRWVAFPTREAAEKAFSDALIKWAKQKENSK